MAALAALVPAGAVAQSRTEALLARGYDLAYNLDHDEALATFRQALALDGDDPAVHRGLAAITWLNLMVRRGSVTVDDYQGSITRPNVPMARPPAEADALFKTSVNRAISIADRRVRARPNDPSAHYELGASFGVLASYVATIEGHLLPAIRAARRAFAAHERVLELDPRRLDAALVVGTYRYVVSQLAPPMRWMAYLVGFAGGRDRGIQMIEAAAAQGRDAQTEARAGLILVYNRLGRHLDALRVIRGLEAAYPRNRVLWLEHGATALRAGLTLEAEAVLTEGLTRLETDRRPKMFGEAALFHLKRGTARVRLGKLADADRDLRAVLSGEARDWVRGRAHSQLGRIADAAGALERARGEYQQAIALGERDSDPAGVNDARALLRKAR